MYTEQMNEKSFELARDTIARLCGQGSDLVTLWKECSEVLAEVVHHYMSPCWYTLDPLSLLVTSHYQAELLKLPAEWLAHEYYEDDVHKLADVARSQSGISTIHEVTGGDPSRSPGWSRYVRPLGGDQELLMALRSRTGEVWGLLGLYREPDQPMFSKSEMRFLHSLSPLLADGARKGLILGEATEPESPHAPRFVILNKDWNVESLTPGVERWLTDLPDSTWEASRKLPPVVLSVAGRALRIAENPGESTDAALARVQSQAGEWIVLHGAAMVSENARRVAVIIEPAHPARIASILMSAYGLTQREQEITRLVLQGYSTTEISHTLFISPQTVQQHLKHIFLKTNVRSRRELVGKVFFAHYEPRVRENEERAIVGQPLRGGPMASQPTD